MSAAKLLISLLGWVSVLSGSASFRKMYGIDFGASLKYPKESISEEITIETPMIFSGDGFSISIESVVVHGLKGIDVPLHLIEQDTQDGIHDPLYNALVSHGVIPVSELNTEDNEGESLDDSDTEIPDDYSKASAAVSDGAAAAAADLWPHHAWIERQIASEARTPANAKRINMAFAALFGRETATDSKPKVFGLRESHRTFNIRAASLSQIDESISNYWKGAFKQTPSIKHDKQIFGSIRYYFLGSTFPRLKQVNAEIETIERNLRDFVSNMHLQIPYSEKRDLRLIANVLNDSQELHDLLKKARQRRLLLNKASIDYVTDNKFVDSMFSSKGVLLAVLNDHVVHKIESKASISHITDNAVVLSTPQFFHNDAFRQRTVYDVDFYFPSETQIMNRHQQLDFVNFTNIRPRNHKIDKVYSLAVRIRHGLSLSNVAEVDVSLKRTMNDTQHDFILFEEAVFMVADDSTLQSIKSSKPTVDLQSLGATAFEYFQSQSLRNDIVSDIRDSRVPIVEKSNAALQNAFLIEAKYTQLAKEVVIVRSHIRDIEAIVERVELQTSGSGGGGEVVSLAMAQSLQRSFDSSMLKLHLLHMSLRGLMDSLEEDAAPSLFPLVSKRLSIILTTVDLSEVDELLSRRVAIKKIITGVVQRLQ